MVEDGAVDMADHRALGCAVMRLDEVHHFLRLVRVAPGMDVQGCPGLPLRDDGPRHDPLFQIGPRGLAANLADHSGADVGTPGADRDLLDHFGGKAVDVAAAVFLILVLVHVMAASHHHMRAGVA